MSVTYLCHSREDMTKFEYQNQTFVGWVVNVCFVTNAPAHLPSSNGNDLDSSKDCL